MIPKRVFGNYVCGKICQKLKELVGCSRKWTIPVLFTIKNHITNMNMQEQLFACLGSLIRTFFSLFNVLLHL